MNEKEETLTVHSLKKKAPTPDAPIPDATGRMINDQHLLLEDLNHQLEELSALIRSYNILNFNDKASQLECISCLMMDVISEKNRKNILRTINQIDYVHIQKSFVALNQICEDTFREKEDLFGILKRHRLNYPVPDDDSMKFYRISQFLNVTLIHFHLQKKKGFRLTDIQKQIKWESAQILGPLLVNIITVLREEIPGRSGSA
jgi:hypothetical protein